MVKEFKRTVVHFPRPNSMQIFASAWIYRWTKKLWKIRTGPPGLRATGLPGRRAAWPPGRGAVTGRGPRAAGRGPRAAGPSGRWAAGLLLAKPLHT